MTQLRLLKASITALLAGLEREDGQTLAEYALILAFITIGVIAVLVIFQGSITGLFNSVSSNI
jgi:Flp pilus assembly pilin Flp